MPSLTFRGAFIRYFDCRLQEAAAMRLKYAEQGTLTEQDNASNAGEKEEVDGEQEEQQPPLDNVLNAMGSGRRKEKGRRGAPVAPAVVSIEPDERKKVEAQIASQIGEVQ